MDNQELKELLGNVLASLNDEQKEQVQACETVDQLMGKLGDMGVELPDELLDLVGGGLNIPFNGGLNRSQPFGRLRLGDLFGGSYIFGAQHMDLTADDPVDGPVHMDLKGTPTLEVTHMDISYGARKLGGGARLV